MEMTPKRIMAAVKRQEPDRVPFCELAIDRALAERLMGGRRRDRRRRESGRETHTVEGSQGPGGIPGRPWHDPRISAETLVIGDWPGRPGFHGAGNDPVRGGPGKDQASGPAHSESTAGPSNRQNRVATMPWLLSPASVSSTRLVRLGRQVSLVSLYTNRPWWKKSWIFISTGSTVVAERMCRIGFDIFWTTDDYAYKQLLPPATFREVIAPRYRGSSTGSTTPGFSTATGTS